MSVNVKTKLTEDDMFRFNAYDAYHSARGWKVIILAVVVFIVAGATVGRVSAAYTCAYVIMGLFLLAYMPFTLKQSSAHAVRSNPILSEPLDYTFDDKGVTIHTEVDLGDEPNTDTFAWDLVYKVVRTKSNLLIYMNRTNAHVLPFRDITDVYPDIEKIIRENVEEYKLKL